MTPSTPQQALPQLPEKAPTPPVFASNPNTKKPGAKSATPTFLGADTSTNPTNTSQKKLVGS